jgi:pantoate--beta-alanine ligase|tara:strand:- start:454 stop:1311 length:858 start_codon:yes stop_codon:yes gene_type:complete
MIKVDSVQGIRKLLSNEKKIAFVPTMGNLHEGHLSLVDLAISASNIVVVSIFINPAQFTSSKDLKNYPRTPDRDIKLLTRYENVIIFMPSSDEIYPEYTNKKYDLPLIANELCGKSRPGHFNGVITIIDKLFDLVAPQVVIFGKKDYQQLFLVKEFSKKNYPKIEVIGGPTIRNKDGLALSSRNNLYSKKQLINAANLYKELQNIVNQVKYSHNNNNNNDNDNIIAGGINKLEGLGWNVDYIEIRKVSDLSKPSYRDRQLVIIGAGIFKSIRLIDSIEFCIDQPN